MLNNYRTESPSRELSASLLQVWPGFTTPPAVSIAANAFLQHTFGLEIILSTTDLLQKPLEAGHQWFWDR